MHELTRDTLVSDTVPDYSAFSVERQRHRNHRRMGEVFVPNGSDWYGIIPLTLSGTVVMVGKFRHWTQNAMPKAPGGIIHAEDGDASHARPEMPIECGHDGETIEKTGVVPPDSAIQCDSRHSFVASDVVPVCGLRQDDPEHPRIRLFPRRASLDPPSTEALDTHSLSRLFRTSSSEDRT